MSTWRMQSPRSSERSFCESSRRAGTSRNFIEVRFLVLGVVFLILEETARVCCTFHSKASETGRSIGTEGKCR